DLHQPLHCADDHDRGGNEVAVTFLDDHESLHSVWDTGLVSELARTDPAMTARLIQAARENRGAKRGTIVEWALESHAVDVDRVYDALPQDRQLEASYVNAQRPTVERALLLAGVHLATVLNRAFGQSVFASGVGISTRSVSAGPDIPTCGDRLRPGRTRLNDG